MCLEFANEILIFAVLDRRLLQLKETDSSFVTARRYASAVLAVVVCPSVCPCVRLCVCLSQTGIVSKRLQIGSRKQRRTIAQGL